MFRSKENKLWLLTVMLVAYGLVYFHRVMAGVMMYEMVTFAEYYSVDPKYLLSLFPSAYFYAYALAQLFVGSLVDSYGVKRTGTLMIALMGASTALMVLPSAEILVAGRFLVGLTAAVVFVASQRVASLGFSSKSQTMITSLFLMVGNVSALFATYPLRLFLSAYGVASLFLMLALLSVAIALLTFIFSRDVGTSNQGIGLKSTWKEMLLILKSKHAIAVAMGAVATYGTGLAFQAAWGQDLMMGLFEMSKEAASMYLMILGLAFVATTFPAAALSDRVLGRRKPVLIAALILSIIAWTSVGVASFIKSLDLFIVGLLLIGISMGLHAVCPPMVREPFGQDFAATATSVYNLILFSWTAVLQSIEPLTSSMSVVLLSLAISLVGLAIVYKYAEEAK
ncbi:MAG: MFS transporter [Candidatus Nezhaarchaeales archaeon]